MSDATNLAISSWFRAGVNFLAMSDSYVRNKYKKKLAQFEETCQIVEFKHEAGLPGTR